MRYVIGCSFVQNWDTTSIFDKNFGCGGADNTYIHHKTVSECIKNKPQYVFLIFTGLARTSYVIHPDVIGLYKGYRYISNIDDESLIFSGGWAGSWTKDTRLNAILKPTHISQSIAHIKQNSLLSILACLNFLDSNDIPYDFTFAYDPLAPEDGCHHLWGSIDEQNAYYKNIPKENYIDKPFLYDYAKDNNMLSDDKVHPNLACYEKWFKEIQHKLKI